MDIENSIWDVKREIVRERQEVVYLDDSRPTPDTVIQYMLNASAPKYDDKVLVLFDPCIALSLRELGVIDITIFLPTFNEKMQPWFDSVGIKVITSLETNMKFDLGLANPPYMGVSATHQKFFNRTVDLLVDGGQMVFIQPATPYINKKPREVRKTAELEMIDNIEKHTTRVKMLNGGNTFDNVKIWSALAVTHLHKDFSESGDIEFIEYINSDCHENVSVSSVHITEMEPTVFNSLKKKVMSHISKQGSLQDIVSKDPSVFKYSLPMIRGTAGCRDMFTFVPLGDLSEWETTDSNFGIRVDNTKQFKNVPSYLRSNVARFCLSIYKFSLNSHRGEFAGVPIVDFNRKWDDKSLCELFGITKKEYKEILRVIPEFY